MTMMDLPSEVDVIVIGTGVTETILSAAFSRAGKTVLHLDSNKYYGSDWASFPLDAFLDWCQQKESGSCFNIESVNFMPDQEENGLSTDDECQQDIIWTWKKFKLLNNKFSIDLCPRLVFSRGPMVDLLVNSNICRYLEFKNCTRLLVITPKEDDTGFTSIQVPCSRESIFNDSSLSLIQKRKLMKFIDYCMSIKNKQKEWDEIKNLSLEDFLLRQGFDDKLNSVINCVAIQETSSVEKFLETMSYFTASVGRFGPTPFLWTLYGSGELPQSFARLSAVFGGTFCLGQQVKEVEGLEDGINVKFGEQEVRCKILVGNQSSLPETILQKTSATNQVKTCHAICFTNQSLKGIDAAQITFARIPWKDDQNITLIEVGSASLCTPKGIFVVYLSCSSKTEVTAKQELMPVIDKLFTKTCEKDDVRDEKPQVLWTCFFNRTTPGEFTSSLKNVSVVENPFLEQDYESSINEAKRIFDSYLPSQEFLPRAPDAEDIILEDVPEEESQRDSGDALE